MPKDVLCVCSLKRQRTLGNLTLFDDVDGLALSVRCSSHFRTLVDFYAKAGGDSSSKSSKGGMSFRSFLSMTTTMTRSDDDKRRTLPVSVELAILGMCALEDLAFLRCVCRASFVGVHVWMRDCCPDVSTTSLKVWNNSVAGRIAILQAMTRSLRTMSIRHALPPLTELSGHTSFHTTLLVNNAASLRHLTLRLTAFRVLFRDSGSSIVFPQLTTLELLNNGPTGLLDSDDDDHYYGFFSDNAPDLVELITPFLELHPQITTFLSNHIHTSGGHHLLTCEAFRGMLLPLCLWWRLLTSVCV